MYSSLLVRSLVRRNVLQQSARCFASRAPPPPPSIPPNVPREESAAKVEAEPKQEAPAESPLEPPAPGPTLSSLPSLDFAPGEEPRGERTGARSSKDSLSSIERKRRLYSRVSIAAILVGLGIQTWYMGRELDEEDLKEFRLVCLISYLLGRVLANAAQETRRCSGIALGTDCTAFQRVV